MKKIILIFLSVFFTAMLCSCSNYYINLKNNTFYINLNDKVSEEISDYVNASSKIMEEMTIDTSNVKTGTMGTYKASITYGDSKKEFDVIVTDLKAPTVTLVKDEFYIEVSGSIDVDEVVKSIDDVSAYEYGFSNDMTIADQRKVMKKSLAFTEEGEFNCEVMAKDKFGNYSVKGFVVKVVPADEIPVDGGHVNYKKFMNTNNGVNISDLNVFDMTGVYYGVGNTVDTVTNRPNLDYYKLRYGNYRVDFIQPESQYVWLTFNEILEYGNTEKILDTLKEKNVSAVFFITKSYAENNPELIRRMIDEGHVLGNYTASGAEVPNLSVNSLTSEIDSLYNYVYETFGYQMYLFRTPSGAFSEQALAVAQSLGYRNVFWSFAYADWNVNAQPEVAEALENALGKMHGGAIYQFSGSSATNMTMLGDFIDGTREKGFEFAIYQKN